MIKVDIPFFPPTANKAYFTRGKMRALSSEGKKFKNEVKNFLGTRHPEVLQFFKPNVEYEILLVMKYEHGSMYTKGWGKVAGVERHKKRDASNLVKLAEDAIVSAAGHDDKQHRTVSVSKDELPPGQEPYFELWAWSEGEHGPIKHREHYIYLAQPR